MGRARHSIAFFRCSKVLNGKPGLSKPFFSKHRRRPHTHSTGRHLSIQAQYKAPHNNNRARTVNSRQTSQSTAPAAANATPTAMAAASLLPPEYGYVLASVAASALLVFWQALRVGSARRRCKVPLPVMYAEASNPLAQVFNCTQRSHQNTLETLAPLLVTQALLGLLHPLTAAALGMMWNVGRVIYTLGYSTGKTEKRLPGFLISMVAYTALLVATLVVGVRMTGRLG